MRRSAAIAIVMAGVSVAAAAYPARAQSTLTAAIDAPTLPPIVAPRVVAPLDQEFWAGVSYREALVGLVVLGGSASVVTWLTGSAISGITAAVTLAAAYVVYDPGVTGVVSPKDLPTLRDLSVNGSAQRP